MEHLLRLWKLCIKRTITSVSQVAISFPGFVRPRNINPWASLFLHSSQGFSFSSAKLGFRLENYVMRQMLRWSPSIVHLAPRFEVPSGLQWKSSICSFLMQISTKELLSCACQSLGNCICPQTSLMNSDALARPLGSTPELGPA